MSQVIDPEQFQMLFGQLGILASPEETEQMYHECLQGRDQLREEVELNDLVRWLISFRSRMHREGRKNRNNKARLRC